MDLEIRAPRTEEAETVYAITNEAFTGDPSARATWLTTRDMAHFLGAFVDGDLAAITETVPLGQHFGGRRVPAGAVASVAVRPERRGRGIGRALLTSVLEHMRRHDLAISTLHPATTSFYRSLGWEVGGRVAVTTIPCRALAALPPGETVGLRRAGSADLERVRACYRGVAATLDGTLDRDDAWWRRTWHLDVAHRYLYVLEEGDRVRGYVLYDQVKGERQWGFAILVREVVAADPSATRTLWRHVGGHVAQVDTVTVLGQPLDALVVLLAEQEIREVDPNHWMTRIVDAPAAVAARGYPEAVRARVELTLVDPVLPGNDGRFVLDVGDGHGALARGGNGGVYLSVNGLAALFTGWASSRVLLTAGLLSDASETEAATLDAMFSGPRPVLLDDF